MYCIATQYIYMDSNIAGLLKLHDDIMEWVRNISRTYSLSGCYEDDKEGLDFKEKLNKWNKCHVLDIAAESLRYVMEQDKIISSLKSSVETLSATLITSQEKVISLQDQLIVNKNEQLAAFETGIKTSVVDSVKTELKSYSSVLQDSSQNLTQLKLKQVVKSVVEEDDRSKNFMIFGLEENDGEDPESAVSVVLSELEEKPLTKSERVGRRNKDGVRVRSRPLKVTVSSPLIVSRILSKAKQLRQSESLKNVYISRDRSKEEQNERRKLVSELKERKRLKPDINHYIKNGAVFSDNLN